MSTLQRTGNKKPVKRWEQMAASTGHCISEFRGFLDVPSRVKKAQEYNGQRPQTKTTTRAYTSRSVSNNVTEDPDCKSVEDKITESTISEISDETLSKLPDYLRLNAQKAAKQGRYTHIKDLLRKRELVSNEIAKRKVPKEIPVSYADYEKAKKEHDEKWEEKIKKFDDLTQQKLNDLNERNMKEMDDFENEWETTMLDRYRKPSGNLIKQRIIETDLIKRDMIEQASWVHEGIIQIEKDEHFWAQKNYENAYLDAKDALERRQSQEAAKLAYARENQRDLLLKDMRKESLTLERRFHVLNSKVIKPVQMCSPCLRNLPARAHDQDDEAGGIERFSQKLPTLHLPGRRGGSTQRAPSSASTR